MKLNLARDIRSELVLPTGTYLGGRRLQERRDARSYSVLHTPHSSFGTSYGFLVVDFVTGETLVVLGHVALAVRVLIITAQLVHVEIVVPVILVQVFVTSRPILSGALLFYPLLFPLLPLLIRAFLNYRRRRRLAVLLDRGIGAPYPRRRGGFRQGRRAGWRRRDAGRRHRRATEFRYRDLMMDAIRFPDGLVNAVRQRDPTQFLNYAHRLLNVLRLVHSVLARVAVHLGTVQGVAANVALIVVAVDFGAAAGQASGPVVGAVGQHHRAGVLLLRQRRRRSVKVTASAAVQSVARRALAARHHHAAQWALIGVVVETSARTATEGGRVQGLRGTAVHHVVVLATSVAVVAVVVVVVAFLIVGPSR